jgi:cbb3-type cytochrome oxidase subunit 3
MNGPYTRPKKTWPLIVVIVFLLGTTFYFWRDARQSAVALEARPADQSQEVADLKKQLKAQATTTATTTVTGFTQAQMDEQVQKAVDDFKAKNPPCLKKDHQPPKKPKAQQAKPPAPRARAPTRKGSKPAPGANGRAHTKTHLEFEY